MEKLESLVYHSTDFDLPLILCVSGGKDSTCLFHLVMEFKDKFNIPPEVIHFNHGLRKESDEEEEFVRKLCDRAGVAVKVFKLKVRDCAKKNGLSVEEAARNLRYEKIEDVTASRTQKGYVFTAHTAGDQAETLILRLIKGTGRSGLQGIRQQRELKSGWILKRPLLGAASAEIMDYIAGKKISFCVDKSNLDLKIPRNFIRHKILKEAKKINPGAELALAKEADILAGEERFLDEEVYKRIEGIGIEHRGDKMYVELNKIISYNEWLKRRIIRKLCPVEPDYNILDSLVDLVHGHGATSHIYIGREWKARKEYDHLIFEKELPGKPDFEYPVIPGEVLNIKETGATIKTRIIEKVSEFDSATGTVLFDADKINLIGLTARSKRAGDRIRLFGGGTKKIKDLCMDLKLSLDERNKMVLVAEDGRILWVAPYRRSDAAVITRGPHKLGL
jgi:tRNA(Ile)-lysidine synthase